MIYRGIRLNHKPIRMQKSDSTYSMLDSIYPYKIVYKDNLAVFSPIGPTILVEWSKE